jgi:cell wall-associated NlpC family hydrolase
MAPTGSHRRVQVLSGGTAVVVLMSILMAGTAPADPIADVTARAAALARTIDAQGRQVEQLAEQYDGARFHAQQVDSQLAAAEAGVAAATRQDTEAQAAMAGQAVEAYIHGGYLSPPRTAPYSGQVDLAVQKDYFSVAMDEQVDTLGRLQAAKEALDGQRLALQVAQTDARAAVVTLAARQRAVAEADAADKATLAQVKGQLVQLVAQQQAVLEAARVAQEQRVLAAQQAAAAAAARAAQAAQAAQAAAQARAAAQAAAQAQVMARRSGSRGSGSNGSGSGSGGSGSGGSGSGGSGSGSGSSGSGSSGVSAPGTSGPVVLSVPRGSSDGLVALAYAVSQLGKPYQWGAAGPATFDCSGLTMRAWQAAGVSLPHFAAAQYADIARVAISDLQPGDLVFYGSDIHHVGIYAGHGQMIDAPFTGAVVRYDSIFWGDLMGAGRPG